MTKTKPILAMALGVLILSGCAPHDRMRDSRAMDRGAVSTPAMAPDRQVDRPPRSFSDPGPNYPDTGR